MLFSPEVIFQALISGVLIGGVFALLSVGLTLIWGVMRIINFAHGEFFMVAMYIVYFLVDKGHWDPYLTLIVSVPLVFLFGVLVYRFTIQPILAHPAMNQIMLTLGLSIALSSLAQMLFSPDPLFVETAYNRLIFNIGPAVVRVPQLIAFAGSALTAVLLYLFLQKTDAGRAIRAASQDRVAATLMGVDARRTFLLAFGLGSACLGVAASLMITFYYVSPFLGVFFGQITFVVVVLGGMGSFIGALVGGLICGLTESLGAAILPGSLSRVLTFTIFILVLLFKPQGLLARNRK